jgi:5,10-methylenetetrahydrofolate reductase
MSISHTIVGAVPFIVLYGTTPPRLDTSPEKYERAILRLAERLRDAPIEGIVIYDVQEESGRTSEPRPFPFLPTHTSRTYAVRVQKETGLSPVVYKCIAGMTEAAWTEWLDDTTDHFDISCLSLVGRATSRGSHSGISLLQAITIAQQHRGGFTLGGVVIPERHRPQSSSPRSESERLLQKMAAGCSYFISQAIYDPLPTIRLLQDYHTDCVAQGIAPSRVLLTFTPCGRLKTLEFMKWLGIHLPHEVESALTTAPNLLDASVDLCQRNLATILASGIGNVIPLGINIESVSISKEEITASITLCTALREIAAPYYR